MPVNESEIKMGDWLQLTKERCGQVKYIGSVDYAEGTHFGVELKGSMGKMSGTFNGKHYFDCEPNRGMLVKTNRIRKILPPTTMLNPDHRLSKMGISLTDGSGSNESNEYAPISLHNQEAADETPEQVSSWDVAEVKRWVNQCLRGTGGELFEKQQIDGRTLLTLTPAELKTKVGLRPGQVRKLCGIMKENFGVQYATN